MELWSRQLLVLERVLQGVLSCPFLYLVVVSYFSVALFFSFSFSLDGGEGRGYIINCNMAIT